MSSKIEKILNNNSIYYIISGIISIIIVWWSPDYFDLSKIYNPGDVLFPYKLKEAVIDRFDSWNHASNLGFGKNEGYNAPIIGTYFSILLLLEKIGFGQGILNRIYLAIPTLIMGISSAIFIIKIACEDKVKIIGVVCAIFFVTSLPVTTLDPILQLSWASLIYLMIIIYQAKHNKIGKKEIILGSICIGILSTTPRFIYLIILIFLYNIIISQNKWNLLKNFIIMTLIALPVYIITIFPSIIGMQGEYREGFITEDIVMDRKSVLNYYKDAVSISRGVLLHYSQPYSWYTKLYEEWTVLLSSLILLIIIIYALIKKNNKENIKFLKSNFIILIIITTLFGSNLYKYLFDNLPGFWILNNPQYYLSIAAIFFAGLLCFGIDSILKDFNLGKVSILILNTIIVLSIISINRVMIFNKIEYNGKIELGQHQKYFEVPEYKNKILKLLECDYSKALLLPSSSNGYYTYKSWPITGMPNIFIGEYCLNVIGASEEEINNLNVINRELSNDFDKIKIENLQKYGIKYIINSNDVDEVNQENKLKIKKQIYRDVINTELSYKIYQDQNIEIYELNKTDPYIKVSNEYEQTYIFESSKQATSYILELEGGHEYSIKTILPKNSAWNIVLLNTNTDIKKISFYDELKLIHNILKREETNFPFISWKINTNESVRAIIYNRASIVNYPYLLTLFTFIYYSTIAFLFFLNNVKKKN